MRRLLGADRALALAERRGRRRVDDPLDAGLSGCADDVLGSADVDLKHRRGVADAEGVETGGVVDELAAPHRCHQRFDVEDVADDRLGA